MTDNGYTWGELVEAEPRLEALLQRARCIEDDGTQPSFCANAYWYGWRPSENSFREFLIRLVGWEAESADPRLKTSAAYDAVYDKIYNALPDCRNCICL